MMTIKEVFFGSDRLTAKQENVRELVMYPFAGMFTALANFLSFVIMDWILVNPHTVDLMGYAFDLTLVTKQFVSWVATILTAYATNRIFVFRSHGNFFIELLGFAAARLSTFVVIELGLFSIMVYWVEHHLGIDQDHVFITLITFNVTCLYVIKIVNNVVLITVNYIMSRWIVFKARDKKPKDKKEEPDVGQQDT